MRAPDLALVIAVGVAVIGQVLYHVTAKSISIDRQPWEVIAGAYFFGFVFVTAIGIYFGNIDHRSFFTGHNLAAALLIGIAVACVELGYLYAYRHGLPVNIGALSVLALTTIALIPVAYLLFSESITVTKIVGITMTISGIWLISSEIRM
jgi:drug/metabolite transporter (DMT)-like permease